MKYENLIKIRETNSSLEKLAIAKNLTKEEHKVLELCFNDTVYGISKAGLSKAIGYDKDRDGTFDDLSYFLENKKESDKQKTLIQQTISLDNFILGVLARSGNAQIDFISKALTMIDKEDIPWYIRILLKEPRLGFKLTSYNKVRKELGMPVIEKFYTKLAKSIKKDKLDTLPFPVICEIKFDGTRCIVEYNNGLVKLTSRQGKDCTIQFPEVVGKIKSHFDKIGKVNRIILDGEIISKDFNSLQKRIGRKSDNINLDDNIKFISWDIIQLNSVDLRDLPLEERKNLLDEYADENKSIVYIAKSVFVLNEYYLNAVEKGEEGIMIKELDSKWDNSRKQWYKYKPVQEMDLRIIDQDFGEGKNKDKVSRVLVSTEDGEIKAWVGSGFSDVDRDYMTHNPIKNRIVKIEYFEITKTDNGFSLRFPRFKMWRHDKTIASNRGE